MTTERNPSIGKPLKPGQWLAIDHTRINQFADVTEDHQYIHTDEERAKASYLGGTIAHGFLNLSLLPKLSEGCLSSPDNTVMGINYGFDKIRFPSPVPSGAKIRTTSTLKRVEIKGNTIEQVTELVVDIEGHEKPACVAESVGRIVF